MTQCVLHAGCACPDNMVQDGNKCMLPTECPNSQCLLPPDVGTGRYYTYTTIPWSHVTVVPRSFPPHHPPGLSCETITTTMERTSAASDCATVGAVGTRTTFAQSSSVRHNALVSSLLSHLLLLMFCKGAL